MTINTKKYIEKFLKIRNKSAEIVPLEFNGPQMKVYNGIKKQSKAGKPIRIIILKARQMGFSTLTEALLFKSTATKENITAGIVAHLASATDNLFKMSKLYFDKLPEPLKPTIKASNAKELIFGDLNSTIKCMTAGGDAIGRSDTYQILHISEYAHWRGDKRATLDGLLQSVPSAPGTMVVIESTANGYDDFKNIWDKAVAGENDFLPIFCGWWELPEYSKEYDGTPLTAEEERIKSLYDLTNDQIQWRRWMISNGFNGNVDGFRQEYPASPDEAFLTSGRPVFLNKVILKRIEELQRLEEPNTYRFVFDWNSPETQDRISQWAIMEGGDIRIYKHPEPGVPYVIGGDTKGEGKDFYAATVLNNITGERVATYQVQLFDSKPYTYQMYCLGMYYNQALIAIEMNFNLAPIEELQRLGYPNQYIREQYGEYTTTYEKKYGWHTTPTTRPLIIDRYANVINNNPKLFHDIPTLREAVTFVYNNKNKPDAMSGKHDDMLMSDMIAEEVRRQQTFEVLRPVEIDRYEKEIYEFLNYDGG